MCEGHISTRDMLSWWLETGDQIRHVFSMWLTFVITFSALRKLVRNGFRVKLTGESDSVIIPKNYPVMTVFLLLTIFPEFLQIRWNLMFDPLWYVIRTRKRSSRDIRTWCFLTRDENARSQTGEIESNRTLRIGMTACKAKSIVPKVTILRWIRCAAWRWSYSNADVERIELHKRMSLDRVEPIFSVIVFKLCFIKTLDKEIMEEATIVRKTDDVSDEHDSRRSCCQWRSWTEASHTDRYPRKRRVSIKAWECRRFRREDLNEWIRK